MSVGSVGKVKLRQRPVEDCKQEVATTEKSRSDLPNASARESLVDGATFLVVGVELGACDQVTSLVAFESRVQTALETGQRLHKLPVPAPFASPRGPFHCLIWVPTPLLRALVVALVYGESNFVARHHDGVMVPKAAIMVRIKMQEVTVGMGYSARGRWCRLMVTQ